MTTDYPYKDKTAPEVTGGHTSHVGSAVLNPGFLVEQPADIPGRFRKDQLEDIEDGPEGEDPEDDSDPDGDSGD